jgi:hypothetical protein
MRSLQGFGLLARVVFSDPADLDHVQCIDCPDRPIGQRGPEHRRAARVMGVFRAGEDEKQFLRVGRDDGDGTIRRFLLIRPVGRALRGAVFGDIPGLALGIYVAGEILGAVAVAVPFGGAAFDAIELLVFPSA